LNPDLDIVIVNWNAGAQLRECLASVAAAARSGFTLSRVVVVDNASNDRSLEGLDELGLPLTIIANEQNRGFGAACNQGAAGHASTYVLFLNPDTRLYANALTEAVAFLESPGGERFGFCGIQLVDAEGRVHRSCTRHPRPRHFAAALTGLTRLAPGWFPSHFMTEWDHAEDREVDHVMGAFLLVRRSVFEELHGFDERFFVYLEDLDLTLRAKRLGWPAMFLARAQAFHRSGGVSEQAKPARLYYSLHSRMTYGHKHFGRMTARALDVGTLTVEPVIRTLAAVVRGRPRELGETARGFARLWLATLTGQGPAKTAGA